MVLVGDKRLQMAKEQVSLKQQYEDFENIKKDLSLTINFGDFVRSAVSDKLLQIQLQLKGGSQ